MLKLSSSGAVVELALDQAAHNWKVNFNNGKDHSLVVSSCAIESISSVPPCLRELTLKKCPVTTLPPFPPRLHTVYLNDLPVESMPSFPQSLRDIDVSGCKKLRTINVMPQQTRFLNITDCQSLEWIPDLPPTAVVWYEGRPVGMVESAALKKHTVTPVSKEFSRATEGGIAVATGELKPTGSPAASDCMEIHRDLKGLVLVVQGTRGAKSLPEFPKFVRAITIEDCEQLASLPQFPRNIAELSIHDCPRLKSLPPLPKTIKNMNISGCERLESIPAFPMHLQQLGLVGGAFKSLPPFPDMLQSLTITHSTVETLPAFNSRLRELWIRDCPNIKELPPLPAGLQLLRHRLP